MGKITISQKGSRTIYRVNRRIVCYRDEHKSCMGKPSSGSTHLEFDALSENIAHERCIEICERRIYAEMKYQNPVAYNAHRALNALAKNGGSNPSDIINQIIKDYEEILCISHRDFKQGSEC